MIGDIGVDGRCSLDRTKPDSEEGLARRWTDGDCVDKGWENKRWRWKSSVGDWRRKDKDTGSEDKQEMVNSSEGRNGESHWDGQRLTRMR